MKPPSQTHTVKGSSPYSIVSSGKPLCFVQLTTLHACRYSVLPLGQHLERYHKLRMLSTSAYFGNLQTYYNCVCIYSSACKNYRSVYSYMQLYGNILALIYFRAVVSLPANSSSIRTGKGRGWGQGQGQGQE